MIALIAELAVEGAISNCVFRGGLIKHWFPKFKGGDILNALFFGLRSWLLSQSPIIGGLLAVAMFIGSMPSIFKATTDKFLALRKPFRWASVVFARGFVWCMPIALSLAPFCGVKSMLFLIPALLMPLAYSWVWFYHKSNGIIHQWSLSEMTFGAILWACLAIL